MSTLAEIEAALAKLSPAEIDALESHIRGLNSTRREGSKVFTGRDAADWWQNRKHLPPSEAESFARDVEAARSESAPPTASAWE